MPRLWRIFTDVGFFIAQIALCVRQGWRVFEWLTGPVSGYLNGRVAVIALSLLALAASSAIAVVVGYLNADEDKGRTLATVWIFIGAIPLVAALVSSDAGGWPVQVGAALFTFLAVAYRFQKRGWLL
jgi:hypothetical protein